MQKEKDDTEKLNKIKYLLIFAVLNFRTDDESLEKDNPYASCACGGSCDGTGGGN
mgnify:CR=1 FL=1